VSSRRVPEGSRLATLLLRWVVAPTLAAALLWRVDLRAILGRLSHLDARFVALFLALSVPYYLLCAWRWSFTAARLGARLPFWRAFSDYYVATLLNQVLPVGIAGDVVRAARHRRALGDTREPWRGAAFAVVLERFSGVVALALFVVASGATWWASGHVAPLRIGGAAVLGLAVVAALGLLAARLARANVPIASSARAALLAGGALRFHLAVSLVAVATLVAMFACAGYAAGIPMTVASTLQVVPLVLAATTLPWAFAGLGPREAVTAGLFALVGLTAEDGVTVSITFGLLGLVAAAPGAIVLVVPRRAARREPA
jgi:uncharacterized membrane protein YbhN (UPF0104 family)